MRMKLIDKLTPSNKKIAKYYIKQILNSVDLLTYIISAITLFAIIYQHGFVINAYQHSVLNGILTLSWIVFLFNSAIHAILDSKYDKKGISIIKYILSISLYLTLIPVIFSEPSGENIIHSLWAILHSEIYLEMLIGLLSLLMLSAGIMKLLGKRTNPSLIFASSFFIFIMIGALLLMLPRSTYTGISFIDALFISTSATCVTGLTSVDVATTFTPMGLFIIIVLIQIGGLGVMTFTCFFAMFFMGNTSLYSQIIVRDLISSESLSSLFSTLIYILVFTLSIEAAGAIIIFLDIHTTFPGYTIDDEIAFSIFHSISAFCNAGFSTLPNNLGNYMVMQNHNTFFITISLLIVFGGLGFPILVNLYNSACYELKHLMARIHKRSNPPTRKVHLYNLNTKIVIMMTIILLALGTATILILEWNNSFASLSVEDKFVQAFFNASLPRTAGFSSISPTLFSTPTILIIIILMMIGGGTQSTAGGIKVNVFAVVLLNIRSFIYGDTRVTIFHRELTHDSVKRSNATLIFYAFIAFAGLFLLTIFEPEIDVLSLFFECVSALSTVGSSLNTTMKLGVDSKIVVITLMFVGRVGVLTLLSSIIKQRNNSFYKYPNEDLIIN